jgi:hypothetical protein
MCVCSLSYPACNPHAPYCHLWPDRLYSIFAHYLLDDMTLENKVTEHKFALISHSKCTERDMIKTVYWSALKITFSLSDFNES